MAKRDYYEILGVSKNASADEIKSAYRKLAMKHHPDKGGAHDAFKDVNEAYQVLGDNNKRATYDQFGHAGVGGSAGGQQGAGFNGFDFADFNINVEDMSGGFEGIFDSFFGGRARTQSNQKTPGRDIETRIKISFTDSIFGINKEIAIDRVEICGSCHGNRAEPGSNLRTCLNCSGTGEERKMSRTFLGTFTQSTVCHQCLGTGKIPEKFCKKCSGTGKLKNRAQISVKIPAGIKSGSTIRLAGEGEAGESGAPLGDLYIHVLVEESSKFNRVGDNIISELSIDFVDAALGVKKEIETVYGKETINIKPGIQSGEAVVFKNLGAPDINSGRKGDHVVKVIVTIPKKISRKQRKLLEDFKDAEGFF